MKQRSIVHVEIPSGDRMTSAKFYNKLFGWEYEDMPEMNYTTFSSGSLGGGYNPLGETVKAGEVVFYISSDDIEADLKAIEAEGGKTVVPKSEIPGMGWFALFTDPTGNRVGLYTDMNN